MSGTPARPATSAVRGLPVRALRLKPFLNPFRAVRSLWPARRLVGELVRREVEVRYRGSALGLLWAFLNPLAMLAIYTYVFGVVFRLRWPGAAAEGLAPFALALFCGLIPFNVFAESVTRSPAAVVSVPNYVKRVVFPLEVLPLGILGAVLFHGLVSLLVLAVARIAVLGGLPWTVVLVPLVLAPLVLLAAGLGWFLASLGVFVRDLGHVLTLLVQILLFATPIFYPVEAVPETLRPWVAWQPLAWVVESMRRVVLWGQAPDWVALPLWLAVTGAVALVGYAWFMKTKRAFADVL